MSPPKLTELLRLCYLHRSIRRYCDPSCLFVGLFVNVFASSHPATDCNGRWAAGGSAAGGRRCERLAEVAPYERLFI